MKQSKQLFSDMQIKQIERYLRLSFDRAHKKGWRGENKDAAVFGFMMQYVNRCSISEGVCPCCLGAGTVDDLGADIN